MDSLLSQYPMLSQNYFGNYVYSYVVSLCLFFLYTFVFKIIQLFILNRLKAFSVKTATDIDDTLVKLFESLKPPFYAFLAFYLALQSLTLSPYVQYLTNTITIIWAVYQVVYMVQIIISYITKKRLSQDENQAETAAQALSLIAKILLWSLGVLLVLSNIGVDVTSLIAGLGISGVAVAFAVKDILGDLFSSFTIYFDKPFKVGDFIILGDINGTVKKIGIKTTRIKSLQGQELIIPNQKLTSEVVQNYNPMQQRRVDFKLRVAYETDSKKLEKIPDWIREIIEAQEVVEFGRAHLKQLGETSLVYEIIYSILESDYAIYMDTQHTINLSILKKLEKEKVAIAYPTQTLHIKK